MAATEAQKVVLRCEDAKETGHLDMSECALMTVPNAIYMLLSATPPTTCNLSHNDMKKIPVKLCNKFPNMTELRAEGNKIKTIPEEIGELKELRILDVSKNKIEQIPNFVYTIVNLEELSLDNNQIQDIDVDELMKMPSLKKLSLCNNPLQENTRARLEQCARFTINL